MATDGLAAWRGGGLAQRRFDEPNLVSTVGLITSAPPMPIDDARTTTLTAAFHANPARFGRRPRLPTRPDKAWINQPQPALPE